MNIDFSCLKQKEILIYDGASLPALEFIFKKKNYNIFFNRGEKINFWIFLKVFLKFNFKNYKALKKNYKIQYIKKCSPKLIITYIDNNPAFYELKKLFPQIKFISIQNGIKLSTDLSIFKKKSYCCDYFFIFNDFYKKYFSRVIKSNFISHGSLKMNYIKKQNYKKKNKVLFISQTGVQSNYLDQTEKILIKKIFEICKHESIGFNILCKKNVKNLIINEIKDIKPIDILESKSTLASYNYIQKYNLKIFMNSTLGFEALSIGEKCISFPLGSIKKDKIRFNLNKKIEKFGYPSIMPNEGYCWLNNFDTEKLKEKIIYLFNLNRLQWNKMHTKEMKNKMMIYDNNNSKLKKILKKIKIKI